MWCIIINIAIEWHAALLKQNKHCRMLKLCLLPNEKSDCWWSVWVQPEHIHTCNFLECVASAHYIHNAFREIIIAEKMYRIADFYVLTPSYISDLHAHWIRFKREYLFKFRLCWFFYYFGFCSKGEENRHEQKYPYDLFTKCSVQCIMLSSGLCLFFFFFFFCIVCLLFANFACICEWSHAHKIIMPCGWFDLCCVVHYKGNICGFQNGL